MKCRFFEVTMLVLTYYWAVDSAVIVVMTGALMMEVLVMAVVMAMVMVMVVTVLVAV